jgi:hypothetical protein
MNTNAVYMENVGSKIGAAIVDFCSRRLGMTIHAEDLRNHVSNVVGKTAPGSADRILRDLRQRGKVNYDVVNRRQSLYRITDVSALQLGR